MIVFVVVVVVVVVLNIQCGGGVSSSRARISGECSTLHSPPAIFYFLSGD